MTNPETSTHNTDACQTSNTNVVVNAAVVVEKAVQTAEAVVWNDMMTMQFECYSTSFIYHHGYWHVHH